MSDIKQEVKPEVKSFSKVVVPQFDQYINVILTKENYEVVKEAVTKNPAKLQKIMQYVNSPAFKQDQLKEVFSRPVF